MTSVLCSTYVTSLERGTHFQVPRYIVYREDQPLWDCANMLGLSGSGTLSYAVLVYLCICIFVCAFDTWEYHFDILEQSSFKNYITCWVFLALCHMLYFCICEFCICIFCICACDTREYNFSYP